MKLYWKDCSLVLLAFVIAACGGREELATDGIVAVTLTSKPTEIEFSQVQLSIEDSCAAPTTAVDPRAS